MSWTAGEAVILHSDYIPASVREGEPIGIPPGPDVDLATVMSDGSDDTFVRTEFTEWVPSLGNSAYKKSSCQVRVVPTSSGPLPALDYSFRIRVTDIGDPIPDQGASVSFYNTERSLYVETQADPLTHDGQWYRVVGTVSEEEFAAFDVTLAQFNDSLNDLWCAVTVANTFTPDGPSLMPDLSVTSMAVAPSSAGPVQVVGTGAIQINNGGINPPHKVGVGPGGCVYGLMDDLWDYWGGRPGVKPARIWGARMSALGLSMTSGFGAPTASPSTFEVRVTDGPDFDAVVYSLDLTITNPSAGGAWQSFFQYVKFADTANFNPVALSDTPYLWLVGKTGYSQLSQVYFELLGEHSLMADLADMASMFAVDDPDPIGLTPNLSGNLKDVDRSFT